MRAFTLLVLTVGAVAADRPPRPYTELRGRPVLWHDPGAVERLDLGYGFGGRSLEPRAPFRFVKEDTSGSNPKVLVRDANGRQWAVKFGEEARPDTFCTRLAWASGYFVEVNRFVRQGTVLGVRGLKRARREVDAEGHFQSGARFQLRSKYPEYVGGVSWSWNDNPFLGTREFNGLRILTMLVSNWDDKDFRDEAERGLGSRYHELLQEKKRGSNNAIYKAAGGSLLFFIDDWGASLGNWGGPLARTKWDCVDYSRQSAKFVQVRDGRLEWGYKGIHTRDMTDGIRVSDVRWLLQYLGRISDAQLRAGLLASGATKDEAYCYTMALRTRIDELREAAAAPAREQVVTRAR